MTRSRDTGPGPGPRVRTPAVIEIERVDKRYLGLRPLRLTQLVVRARERVAIAGLDAQAAEVLVDLITGATLPDAGEVRVFDASTATIATSDAWFGTLDRFGIVTNRSALLEGLTTAQNVALPLTIRIDPVPAPHADSARALADEVGLPPDVQARRVESLSPAERVRVHLARALALDPGVLLLEHPTASLGARDAGALARDLATIAEARQVAVLALTNDLDFASVASHRVVRLRPATGELEPVTRSRWARVRALVGPW